MVGNSSISYFVACYFVRQESQWPSGHSISLCLGAGGMFPLSIPIEIILQPYRLGTVALNHPNH